MGLIVGNQGRRKAMSETTQKRLFDFWDVLDDLLNLLLFGLIGLVMMALSVSAVQAVAAACAVVIVLVARLVSVGVPIALVPRLKPERKASKTGDPGSENPGCRNPITGTFCACCCARAASGHAAAAPSSVMKSRRRMSALLPGAAYHIER